MRSEFFIAISHFVGGATCRYLKCGHGWLLNWDGVAECSCYCAVACFVVSPCLYLDFACQSVIMRCVSSIFRCLLYRGCELFRRDIVTVVARLFLLWFFFY
jgi:hypothetical protein